jgi:hypothetical protein
MISSFMIAPQDEMKMKSSKYLNSVAQLFTSTKKCHNLRHKTNAQKMLLIQSRSTPIDTWRRSTIQWLMEQAIDLLNGDAVTQSIHELEPLLLPITA